MFLTNFTEKDCETLLGDNRCSLLNVLDHGVGDTLHTSASTGNTIIGQFTIDRSEPVQLISTCNSFHFIKKFEIHNLIVKEKKQNHDKHSHVRPF